MYLLLVNGKPATGKTTLSRKLATDLQTTLFSKDSLKEFMFDYVGNTTKQDSRIIGTFAAKALWQFTDEWLKTNRSLIIESVFDIRYARTDLRQIIDAHEPRVIELHCVLNEVVRLKRFEQRTKSTRHAGHFDAFSFVEQRFDDEPIGFGELITIDTLDFDEQAYNKLLKRIRAILKV